MPPLLARTMLGLPLLTWTVRSEVDRRLAARWADQIIFEGWRPLIPGAGAGPTVPPGLRS